MPGASWTDKEIEILRNLADKGYSAREIRRALKSRTLVSIKHKCLSLEICLAPQPEVDLNEYKNMMKVVRA